MNASGAVCWYMPVKVVKKGLVVHIDLSETAGSERERRKRFLFDGPRRRFALCRAALRAIPRNRLDYQNGQLAFESAKYGKPVALVDGMLALISFKVSHSGEHGLMAFAPEGRLGV